VLVLGLGAAGCGVGAPLPGPAPDPEPSSATPAAPPAAAATPVSAETPAPAGTTPPAATPAPAPRTRAELEADAEAGLARLRALEVVQVNTLVLDLPAAARQCYGLCWDRPEYHDMIVAEYERQLPRLNKLAEIGEGVPEHSYPTVSAVERAAPAVAALESLEIVDLGGLLTVAPRNNPNCYNLPCQDDVTAARTENESRSWYVQRWAQLASNPKP
jgi:hypothetical protein